MKISESYWRTAMIFVCSLFGMLCFLIAFPEVAFAVNSLPPGVVIGDNEGFYANSEGDYYVDIPNALPGECYEKEITIRCLDIEEPFELGLLVKKQSSKGPIDFEKHLILRLILDGKEIYNGPLLGDGTRDWSIEPLPLDVCSFGKDHILLACFDIDPTLTADFYHEESEMLFEWQFVATKNQSIPPPPTEPSGSSEPEPSSSSEPKDPSPSSGVLGKNYPKTGENNKNNVLKMVSGILLIMIVLLVWKQRREHE